MATWQPDNSVLNWLMEGDPALRWQVMRDLLDAPPHEVAAERACVATEGFGAQLLALQEPDGAWGGGAFNQEMNSTMHVLSLLREFGLDPASNAAQRAIQRVREGVYWQGWDWDGEWRGMEFRGNPFFSGEVEPCINGQAGASGAYFGQEIERILDWLVVKKDIGQLADGGWNCEAERGSTRGSFNSTICVLECLLEYELAGGTRADVKAARPRGEEYLLERHLFRSKSTGEPIAQDRAWRGTSFTQFAFPTWWHYDVLRGLDYFRHASVLTSTPPDARLAEAIGLVESKRDASGRWPLEKLLDGQPPIDLGESVGEPSRWITMRALRVLRWYAADN